MVKLGNYFFSFKLKQIRLSGLHISSKLCLLPAWINSGDSSATAAFATGFRHQAFLIAAADVVDLTWDKLQSTGCEGADNSRHLDKTLPW